MDLTGLELVEGKSYEMIVRLLTEKEIPFETILPPRLSSTHFRNSMILVDHSYERRVREALGQEHRSHTRTRMYYANYEIGPEFDLRQLDGSVRFNKGLLVEKVNIKIRNR